MYGCTFFFLVCYSDLSVVCFFFRGSKVKFRDDGSLFALILSIIVRFVSLCLLSDSLRTFAKTYPLFKLWYLDDEQVVWHRRCLFSLSISLLFIQSRIYDLRALLDYSSILILFSKNVILSNKILTYFFILLFSYYFSSSP